MRSILIGIGLGIVAFGQPKLITLNVAAIDAKGDPVTDLRPDDLRLREDGKDRPIAFFRFDGSRRTGTPAAPGQFVNHPEPPATLILFDRWNERIGAAAAGWNEINAALQHQESVDNFFIYIFTARGELVPVAGMPDNGQAITEQKTAASLSAQLNDAVQKLNAMRDIGTQLSVERVDRTFKMLTNIGQTMSVIAGRKNLIWVTHGIPLSVQLPGGNWTEFKTQVRDLGVMAAQSGIVMYTVAQSEEGVGAALGTQTQAALQNFADFTGGRSYASDKIENAITDAIADGRGNYRLAYYSEAGEKEHKQHKIRLESLRKGVQLRTRESYGGDAAESTPEHVEQFALVGECKSPFDASDIGLRVAVSKNRADGKQHFDVAIDPADLLIEQHGDRYEGRLGVMLAFYTDQGLQQPSPPTQLKISMPPERFKQVAQTWIHIGQDAAVSDNVRKVRVIVFDRSLDALGSVTIPMK